MTEVGSGVHLEPRVAGALCEHERLPGALDRPGDVAEAEPAQLGEVTEHAAPERRIRACIVQRVEQQRLGGRAVVVLEVGAAHERLDTPRPGRKRVDQPVGERERTADLACGGQLLDLGEGPAERGVLVVGRREPEAVGSEIGC